jgi:hypothetical protein
VIGIVLEGWDGSVWDLRTGSVVLTPDGIVGLKGLAHADFVQDTALRDGQIYNGSRALPRDVMLPVLVGRGVNNEADWHELNTRWWSLMQPGRYSTLWVTAPNGSTRTLSIRFVDDGDGGSPRDPSAVRREVWPIRFVADDPWYYGDDFGRSFKNGGAAADEAPRNFYGGGPVTELGYGPPFYIARGSRQDETALVNTGDTKVWPVLEFDDALSRFKVTIGDGVIAGETPKLQVLTGQTLRIETSPIRQVALLIDRASGSETNVTRQLSAWGFRPIPPGATQDVRVEAESEGDYRIIALPQFLRGW